MSWTEAPHIVLATVIERDNQFLMVEELANGEVVLNQPAGHWEPGETFIEGAIRETLEETAWQVRIDALLGLYVHQPEGLDYPFVRIAFVGTPDTLDKGRIARHRHSARLLDGRGRIARTGGTPSQPRWCSAASTTTRAGRPPAIERARPPVSTAVGNTLPQPGQQIVVGMSGGVDSSVTAHLLKQHGCRVTGLFMVQLDRR